MIDNRQGHDGPADPDGHGDSRRDNDPPGVATAGGRSVGRRGFLLAAAVGAGGAVFTAPLTFAGAGQQATRGQAGKQAVHPGVDPAGANAGLHAGQHAGRHTAEHAAGLPGGQATAPAAGDETKVITGTARPGAPDWVYIPLDTPAGVREIAVSYSYDRPAPPPGVPGNALDIGIFDENGFRLGDQRGFRGWSGGFRTAFTISRTEATPGYVAGRINPGRWHIILGPYTVHPNGLNWRVEVTLRFGEPGPEFTPNPAPTRAKGRGAAWYRGDMHLHTQHSDGARTPAEVAAGARAAWLDYIVSTEHNTHTASLQWGEHAGDDLLILDGEEITTRNGHYLAIGLPAGRWIDWRYRSVDGVIDRFTGEIHRLGGLAVAAHPFCPFVGCAWKFGFDGFDAIEVWNGPWTIDDDVSVAQWDSLLVASVREARGGRTGSGPRWIPAVGNSDAHREPQVIGLPQNVVYAADLEKRAILAGIRSGRLWIAESAAVNLSMSAAAGGRRAGIGQRLGASPGDDVTVEVQVGGADGCVVRLITDEGQLLQSAPLSGTQTVTWTTTPRLSAYVRAEVRRPDPASPLGVMVAMTNPVFLGRP